MIFIIVFAVLFLDRITKYLVCANIDYHQSIPVINGIFHITLIHNRGAAFGILKDQIIFLIFISLFAVGLIFFNLKKNRLGKAYNLSLALILAGALGNLIDRLFFGYVIDFLDLRIWPVFNIADSAITIGAVIMGIFLFKPKAKNL